MTFFFSVSGSELLAYVNGCDTLSSVNEFEALARNDFFSADTNA
jgi:hypothetical protein